MKKKKGISALNYLRKVNINKTYPNIKTLGEISRKKFFCKYLDVEGFYNCIENHSILFKEPCGWDDSYESKLYCADFSKVGLKDDDIYRSYAYCVTDKLSSEASWKAYLRFEEESNQNQGENKVLKQNAVMMKIKSSSFRKALSKAIKDSGLQLYEGQVKYVDVKDIDELGLKNSKIYKRMFPGKAAEFESFLSSILLKRLTFSYEKETRFFLVDNNIERHYNKYDADKKILEGLDWPSIIDKVVVCPTCPDQLYDEIVKKCQENNINNVKRSKLYVQQKTRFKIGNEKNETKK